MTSIRSELVNAAFKRACALNLHTDIEEEYQLRRKSLFSDNSLTDEEKSEVINILNEDTEFYKVTLNKGLKRVCEICKTECLAITYCEYCVRNHLKSKFSSWTSGNDEIDNIIRKCQMETFAPYKVIEWIPYSNLKNVNYFTKGGCSEIYKAVWIGGRYHKWSNSEQQLVRDKTRGVILKSLDNIENANRSWLEEAEMQLKLSNKWKGFIESFGITQDPINKVYFLVMWLLNTDLRKYLQQNHNKLTWIKRLDIIMVIIVAIRHLHDEGVIHRDLHSGNILYKKYTNSWYISDFGFCGPADMPLQSIYGNLPYIAPEVISDKRNTRASDIYSIGMLMWEISSGQPPFAGIDHDFNLAMKIINGIRPKIVSRTPLGIKELIEQCWDADPSKRPNIGTLDKKVAEIRKSYYQNENEENLANNDDRYLNVKSNTSSSSSSIYQSSRSSLYAFRNLPKPRNAIEDYDSKQNDFSIPNSINSELQSNLKEIRSYSIEANDSSIKNEKTNPDNKETLIKYNSNKAFQYTTLSNYFENDENEIEI